MVPIVVFAMMTLVGLALALDFRGISTRLDRGVREWWTAGPIRRAFHTPWHEQARLFGALFTVVNLFGLIASIIGAARGHPVR